MKQKTEYDIQAETFAAKHNLTMTAQYLGHYPRLHGTWITANYRITLSRPNRKTYSFDFSTSINDSWEYSDKGFSWKSGLPRYINTNEFFKLNPSTEKQIAVRLHVIRATKNNPPSLYDVLASIEKNEVGTFEDFCADFGYDEDSRKAYKVYEAVRDESIQVQRLFSDCLEELQEIN